MWRVWTLFILDHSIIPRLICACFRPCKCWDDLFWVQPPLTLIFARHLVELTVRFLRTDFTQLTSWFETLLTYRSSQMLLLLFLWKAPALSPLQYWSIHFQLLDWWLRSLSSVIFELTRKYSSRMKHFGNVSIWYSHRLNFSSTHLKNLVYGIVSLRDSNPQFVLTFTLFEML